MKILVTGAAGFVGTALCRILRSRGDDVRGIDMYEERVHGNVIKQPNWIKRCSSGAPQVTTLLSKFRPDAVVHLAAQVSVADSMRDPELYIQYNSEDTSTFLWTHLARRPPKRLLVASSMSVYGEGSPGGALHEGLVPRPASVYGLTKLDQECLSLIWGAQHGVPVAAMRFFNIYGPGQALTNPYTGVLANFANWIARDEAPVVFEDGLQTRDFIHVLDIVRGIMHLLDAPTAPTGVFNLGTGAQTTIKEAAERMISAWGKDALRPNITHQTRPGDIRHAFADIGRMRALGWVPRIDFPAGIKSYVKWLKEQK